jgi:site-specific DNA recombinase
MYAAGKSPGWIAGELNRLGVPSPGARWQRKERRTDGKWMCSAIAGDAKRGVGILNNELYRGVRIWDRSQRVKEENGNDSFDRRPESDYVRARVPALRIVSDEVWERVKARQRAQSERIGARVKAGLTREEARRTGKRPQYVFSGLCKCGLCRSNFVVSGPSQSYVCAWACAAVSGTFLCLSSAKCSLRTPLSCRSWVSTRNAIVSGMEEVTTTEPLRRRRAAVAMHLRAVGR